MGPSMVSQLREGFEHGGFLRSLIPPGPNSAQQEVPIMLMMLMYGAGARRIHEHHHHILGSSSVELKRT